MDRTMAAKEVSEVYAARCVELAKTHRLELVGINQAGFVTAEQFKVFGRALDGGKVELIIPSSTELNEKGIPKQVKIVLDMQGVMGELLPLIRTKAKANHKVLGLKVTTEGGGKKTGKGDTTIE